jgi:sarcosine oxidase subunit gamma
MTPTDTQRRSFVARELVALGAAFTDIGGFAAPLTCGASAEEEAARARRLGLCEASALARGGYKGWTALDWLREKGVGVPEQNNRARRHDGALVARLADSEALILGGLDGGCALLDDLAAAPPPDGCYPVPRADANAAFIISGSAAPAMLAKLCAVDLRPRSFPDLSLAQTSVARLNAIVLRADIADTVAFHCLFDSASALYLWHCLIDAMAEFDGWPVGLAAARQL